MKRYDSITDELLEIIQLHVTPSSIRRACSMASQIIEQDETEKCPRLFYVTFSNNPKDSDWEVHACDCDIVRYLLGVKFSIEDSEDSGDNSGEDDGEDLPVDNYGTKIEWDKINGGPDVEAEVVNRHDGETHYSTQCLQIAGEISYNEQFGANLIGFNLIFDPKVVRKLGYPVISSDQKVKFGSFENNIVNGKFIVNFPGESHYIKIEWSNGGSEEFGVEVLQEVLLETNDITTEDEFHWALSHNSRVTLGSDITLTSKVEIPDNAYVDINLNDYTIYVSSELGIINRNRLTVRNGSIVGSEQTINCLQNEKTASLELSNIQIDHRAAGESLLGYAAVYNNQGSLIVDGGDSRITSKSHAILNRGLWESTSEDLSLGITEDPSAIATIFGGTFVSNSETGYAIYNIDNAQLNVDDGVFEGPGAVAVDCAKVNLNKGLFKASKWYGLYLINSEANYSEGDCQFEVPEYSIYIQTNLGDYNYSTQLNGNTYVSDEGIT